MGAYPSSDFYWADWENDPLLKATSLAAQGLWMRICCRCHHAPDRGYLLNEDGSQFTLDELAGQVGKSAAEIAPLIEELKARKVCGIDPKTGGIFNRRMVIKEPAKRARAYTNGKKGGNPHLIAEAERGKNELRKLAKREQEADRKRRYRASKKAALGAAAVPPDVPRYPQDEAGHVPRASAHVPGTKHGTHRSQGVANNNKKTRVPGVNRPLKPLLPSSPSFLESSSERLSSVPARAATPPKGGGAREPSPRKSGAPIQAPSESDAAFAARLASWKGGNVVPIQQQDVKQLTNAVAAFARKQRRKRA